jgi:hypothetical protein
MNPKPLESVEAVEAVEAVEVEAAVVVVAGCDSSWRGERVVWSCRVVWA